MIKPVIVLGAGGHARVLVDILQELRVPIHAIVAPDIGTAPEFKELVRLHKDDEVLELGINEIELVNAIGSVPVSQKNKQSDSRRRLFSFFTDSGYRFKTLISPTAIVSRFAEINQGVQILPGAIINGCVIGRNTIINTGSIVEHDVKIGNHCHIAPGATICGGVHIGEGVHIGANATIIQGVKIGNSAIVGAGSIVTKNLVSGAIHYPARPFIKKGNC